MKGLHFRVSFDTCCVCSRLIVIKIVHRDRRSDKNFVGLVGIDTMIERVGNL